MTKLALRNEKIGEKLQNLYSIAEHNPDLTFSGLIFCTKICKSNHVNVSLKTEKLNH